MQTQLKKRIKTLMRQSKPEFDRLIDRAINSGAIDLGTADDNFLLAKIVLCAVYSEMSDQHRPLDKKAKQEVTNLKVFL